MLFQNLISPLISPHCCRRAVVGNIIYFRGSSHSNTNKNNNKFVPRREYSWRRNSSSAAAGNANSSLGSGENFKSIKYWTENKGRVAHLMLNRPHRLNAIDMEMPLEIERAIKLANFDEAVKVILIYGAGDAFCSGYDLKLFSEGKRGEMMGNQKMPWCPLVDFRLVFFGFSYNPQNGNGKTVHGDKVLPCLQSNEPVYSFLYGDLAESEAGGGENQKGGNRRWK